MAAENKNNRINEPRFYSMHTTNKKPNASRPVVVEARCNADDCAIAGRKLLTNKFSCL